MQQAEGGSPERVGVVVIHGVGETETGWTGEYVVKPLETHGAGLRFDPFSEVHTLKDHGASDERRTFHAFVRRGTDGEGRKVSLFEMYWADLSRIGNGPFTSTVATIRLFYEAPMVFGSAALQLRQSGGLGLLRFLILLANWLLRWPITGTNVGVFCCCLMMLLLQRISAVEWAAPVLHGLDIIYPIGATLLVVAVAGLVAGRSLAHRDIALADVGLSTFVCSILMLGALAARWAFDPASFGDLDDTLVRYLVMASWVILPFWLAWSTTIVLAILLLAALALVRLLGLASARSMPLARPAAALGLSTIQGMIWKIFVALLWVLLIRAVVKGGCAEEVADSPQELRDICGIHVRLTIVALSNATMALALAGAFFLVISLRLAVRALRPKAVLARRTRQPRLIVSPVIIALMFCATLVNFYFYYGPDAVAVLHRHFELGWTLPFSLYDRLDQEENRRQLREILGLFAGTGSTALFTYLSLIRSVQQASRGFLHIARDLVDHQYTPRYAVSRNLLPRGRRYTGKYPRRDRIQGRLDRLMDTVVAAERLDRVIFVGHSQGTVILYDYLRSGRDDKDLAEARRIDVVTLASPLTHLYQHYFPSYQAGTSESHRLNAKLASWTNFWRIDDPIGDDVHILRDGFVQNIALRRGGHVGYWDETAVAVALADLISGRGAPGEAERKAAEAAGQSPVPSPGQVAGAAPIA